MILADSHHKTDRPKQMGLDGSTVWIVCNIMQNQNRKTCFIVLTAIMKRCKEVTHGEINIKTIWAKKQAILYGQNIFWGFFGR